MITFGQAEMRDEAPRQAHNNSPCIIGLFATPHLDCTSCCFPLRALLASGQHSYCSVGFVVGSGLDHANLPTTTCCIGSRVWLSSAKCTYPSCLQIKRQFSHFFWHPLHFLVMLRVRIILVLHPGRCTRASIAQRPDAPNKCESCDTNGCDGGHFRATMKPNWTPAQR
jgi:hypothetical protein